VWAGDGDRGTKELEMLADLAEWRINWEIWSGYIYGSVDKRSEYTSP
jgi:hypothetical protein